MTLYEVAQELSNRLASIFLLDHSGHRPVFGGAPKFVDDPHFRDYLLFYEYFHGDNGAGLGASHQTGWTAVIPGIMHMLAMITPEALRAPDLSLGDVARRDQPELPVAAHPGTP
jgi:hypothetical protein